MGNDQGLKFSYLSVKDNHQSAPKYVSAIKVFHGRLEELRQHFLEGLCRNVALCALLGNGPTFRGFQSPSLGNHFRRNTSPACTRQMHEIVWIAGRENSEMCCDPISSYLRRHIVCPLHFTGRFRLMQTEICQGCQGIQPGIVVVNVVYW